MENDREVDKILMNIRGTTGAVVGISLISARLTLQTLIFLMRMAKKGLLAARHADNFKAFMEKTEGKYTVYNIPLSARRAERLKELGDLELKLQDVKNPFEKSALQKQMRQLKAELPELEQLKKLGISHCVLPKINGSSQTIQVAVDNKNDQMFKNWFLNHLTTELKGGEKQMEDIKVMTEGNYTIFNLPFEGQELHEALPDFDVLGINYAVLPDLKVGDNNSQIAVPNADRNKLEVWFKMWKEKQIKEGKEPGEMYAMDQSSYMSTAAVEPGEYEQTADAAYQEANAEFEQQAEDVPWKAEMQKENCEEYVRLLKDNNYEKITINREKLVYAKWDGKAEEMAKNGYFISRVPYTNGANRLLLAVPENKVFLGDEGKTYIAFLPKNSQTMFIDNKGRVHTKNFKEAYAHYDEVTRRMRQVEGLKKGEPLPGKNPAKDAVKAAPEMPKTPKAPKTPKTPRI